MHHVSIQWHLLAAYAKLVVFIVWFISSDTVSSKQYFKLLHMVSQSIQITETNDNESKMRKSACATCNQRRYRTACKLVKYSQSSSVR